MAGIEFRCDFDAREFSVAAGTTRILGYVKAAAQQRVRLKKWILTVKDAAAANKMIKVSLVRLSTDGTAGGDGGAATNVKIHSNLPETLGATAVKARTAAAWSVDPTVTDRIASYWVHPNNGYQFDPGDALFDIAGGGRMGIEVTTQDDSHIFTTEGIFSE